MIILIVVLSGCGVSLFGGFGGSNAYTPASAEVEAYEPLIQQYAKQYGIPEYAELIKAVMMQESGGHGLDPMQAAEEVLTHATLTSRTVSKTLNIQSNAVCRN